MVKTYGSRICLIASFICFLVAWLLTIDTIFHSGNETAWVDGGFIFLVLSMLLPVVPASLTLRKPNA